LREALDEVVERSTGGQRGDERRSEPYELPTGPDERFTDCDKMVILFVFLLGIGNFTLHHAVLESRHPLVTQMAWLVSLLGGRGSLALEFALLLAAMLLVASGHPGWAWAYLGYTALNGAYRVAAAVGQV
jgi:hypothetical protein